MIKNANRIAVAGIIIASLGIISPIVWDIVKNKTSISIIKEYSSSLLSNNIANEKIEIKYDGKNIDNISKTQFTIKNTGRTPIISSDIVSPIKIGLANGNILDSSIEKLLPQNITTTLNINNDNIKLSFDLLNPGDIIIIDILSDSNNAIYTCQSRIKNISTIKIEESRVKYKIVKRIDWTFILVMPITLFCIFALVCYLISGDKKKRNIALNRLNSYEYVKNNIITGNDLFKCINDITITDTNSKFILRNLRTKVDTNFDESNKNTYINQIVNILNKDKIFEIRLVFVLLILLLSGVSYCIQYFI